MKKIVRITTHAVKPVSEDWLDLSDASNLTLAPDASLGFHDTSYDIAVGWKSSATVWERDSVGMYPTVAAAVSQTGGAVIHAGACSLRYDPTFEIVFKGGTLAPQFHIGIASEAIGDHGQSARGNLHRAYMLWASTLYGSVRGDGSVFSIGSYTFVANNYYRIFLDPEDGGRMEVYDLGLAPVSYDGGAIIPALSGYVSRGTQLLGGNVLAPVICPALVSQFYGARIVATRTTMRRS